MVSGHLNQRRPPALLVEPLSPVNVLLLDDSGLRIPLAGTDGADWKRRASLDHLVDIGQLGPYSNRVLKGRGICSWTIRNESEPTTLRIGQN